MVRRAVGSEDGTVEDEAVEDAGGDEMVLLRGNEAAHVFGAGESTEGDVGDEAATFGRDAQVRGGLFDGLGECLDAGGSHTGPQDGCAFGGGESSEALDDAGQCGAAANGEAECGLQVGVLAFQHFAEVAQGDVPRAARDRTKARMAAFAFPRELVERALGDGEADKQSHAASFGGMVSRFPSRRPSVFLSLHTSMWDELATPGALTLLQGTNAHLRAAAQELSHHALHPRTRGCGGDRGNGGNGDDGDGDGRIGGSGGRETHANVLWVDGDHGFNPYDFAELNLTRGHAADEGADRMLVKRCMTPFQWYTALSRLLPDKLRDGPTSVAIVLPFDGLWSTDELSDWEQEDYVRFIVAHLARVARESQVPILLGVDMARWWRTHPVLAQITHDGVDQRWRIARAGRGWKAQRDDGTLLEPMPDGTTTLLDFVAPAERAAQILLETPRGPLRRPWRTRIVHRD